MHAHPKNEAKTILNKVTYYVPENVAQQILIWEEEKNAIVAENGTVTNNSFSCLLLRIR